MDAIAAVKDTPGPDLVIQGSSTLYPQLLNAGMLDELVLMIFPIVLGSGKRLLGESSHASAMRMVEHEITPVGTVLATYQLAGAVQTGSIAAPEPSPAELERRRAMAAGSW